MCRVSVIVPCLNEEDTIEQLLEALAEQSYPSEEMEVLIADGMSDDSTREIIRAWSEKTAALKVRIIDNPERHISPALNLAIAAAQGKYIVRMDAHASPAHDYIERCVALLEKGDAENVGGLCIIEPGSDQWAASSIAYVVSHPIGAGDAKYRISGAAGYVDTVPFGAFRRQLFKEIGPFNEALRVNEDYELNTRIRVSGGGVWFDPQIRSVYFSRGSFSGLAKQYWRYGFWKGIMLRQFPATLRWRQVVPPAFVLSLLSLPVLGLYSEFFGVIFRLELIAYLALIVGVGLSAAIKRRDVSFLPGVPIAAIMVHISWGSGLLCSLFARVGTRFKERTSSA